jgi:hypothetical protein
MSGIRRRRGQDKVPCSDKTEVRKEAERALKNK